MDLWGATERGFSAEALYSTKSYQDKNLRGVNLWAGNLAGWNLEGQDLSNADLRDTNIKNANLKGTNPRTTFLRMQGAAFNQWTRFPDGFHALDELPNGYSESEVGDVDGVSGLNAGDLDVLARRVRDNTFMDWQFEMFDLNSDNSVTIEDHRFWVTDLKRTWFGDTDLDGVFNSSDLISALAAGTYEADVNAGWASGDFDGSGRFDSGDLIIALADGGYEAGPRGAEAVPEPHGIVSLVFAMSGLLFVLRTRWKAN